MSEIKTLIKFDNLPIANNLSEDMNIKNPEFDLHIVFDEETKLVQLHNNVKPEFLFNDTYVYDSSQSKTMVNHFKEAAINLYDRFKPNKVLEIGSNSGIFVNNFIDLTDVIAVEPCGNFADLTNNMNIKTYPKYWNKDVVETILKEDGKQDLIFSANTISHVQNLEECLELISKCLTKKGVFVIEAPSFLEVLKNNTFDQFYHEHQSYFSYISLSNVLSKAGLEIFDVEFYPVHGGSYRYYIGKNKEYNKVSINCEKVLKSELSYGVDSYEKVKDRMDIMKRNMIEIKNKLENLTSEGNIVIGYGATAKLIQVVHMCGLNENLIKYVVDTTLDKQGRYIPNTNIQIRKYDNNCLNGVDYCFLGAWNYKDEILKKEKQFTKDGGKFMTHVPEVSII